MPAKSNPIPEGHRSALSATAAVAAMKAGEFTAEEFVRASLERIVERESTVGAWAFLDEESALRQARDLDARKAAVEELGPLHGVPVGIKDIFDTKDMPTKCGSDLYVGRRPLEDSAAVALLRQAGAVIMGKTVTTEFALSAPGKTVNPHDEKRTPGGSSSGSAAAVADGMVPLAIGTQTGGSVIRPASYCGIYGHKPTFGSISRRGLSMLSWRLDHVGTYARTPEDIALIGDVLMVSERGDRDLRGHPGRELAAALVKDNHKTPAFAFVRGPAWDQAEGDMQAVFEGFIRGLGDVVEEVELPQVFDQALACHKTVMDANLTASLGEICDNHPDKVREETRRRVDAGRNITAADYIRALDVAEALSQAFAPLFDRFDAVLTPAAAGEATTGLDSTGNAAFNRVWTLLGVPAVSVPLLVGENRMPIGVQVIGRRGDDAQVLTCARWLCTGSS